MNVLAQLLPAIREVRSPLVGGYVWLLSAWLFFGDAVPASLRESQVEAWVLIGRLMDPLGAAGLAVVGSVAAYLVGSLAEEVLAMPLEDSTLRSRTWPIECACLTPTRTLHRMRI